MKDDTVKVYEAIANVTADLGEVGISKEHKNAQQGYKFRGIDDVYNVLSRILSKRRLTIIPRVISRECETRKANSGSALYSVCVHVEYDIVSAEDGSKHVASTFGEAMDSADKATNKALSAAYKYMAFQLFCIPVDVLDADATTPPDTLPPGAVSVPKDKPKDKSKSKSAAAMLTLDEVAEVGLAITEANDDDALRKIGSDIFTASKAGRLVESHQHELSVQVITKRCELATKDTIVKVEEMAKAFVAQKLLTAGEAKAAIAATRSRLNLPQN